MRFRTDSYVRPILTLALLLLASACTTPQKRAYGLLEDGKLEEAERAFAQMVRHDPGDDESADGLLSSRQAILAQLLVQARVLRESQKDEASLRTFAELRRKQRLWKPTLLPAAMASIEEEAAIQFQLFEKLIQKDLDARYPLRAIRTFREVEEIFQEELTQSKLETLRAKIQAAGKTSCRSFIAQNIQTQPSLAHLVLDYCRAFGDSAVGLEDVVDQEEASYYRAIQCEVNVENLPRDQVLLTGEAFHKALERTSWYDPYGKRVLQVLIAGGYKIQRTKDPIQLSHTYKKGDEDRTFLHGGWKHHLLMDLTLLAKLSLFKHPLQAAIADRSVTDTAEHHDDIPAIGLKPVLPQLPDEGAWLNLRIQMLASQFEHKARELWKAQYCQPKPGQLKSLTESGNLAAKCVRRLDPNEAPPEWAEAWYQRYLGLGVREVQKVLQNL